jgi:hypothetical protein
MFQVKHIGSAGQTVKTFTARNEAHANRLRERIKATFKTGGSEQVKVDRAK